MRSNSLQSLDCNLKKGSTGREGVVGIIKHQKFCSCSIPKLSPEMLVPAPKDATGMSDAWVSSPPHKKLTQPSESLFFFFFFPLPFDF